MIMCYQGEEDKVEVRPEKVATSCLDENVCLKSIVQEMLAWMVITSVVDTIHTYIAIQYTTVGCVPIN